MTLHLTFNDHDHEALVAIIGETPPDLAEQISSSYSIKPGTVAIALHDDEDGHVISSRTVEVAEFAPLTAGIMLARFAQQDDREALSAWPLGPLDFETEHYQALIGCDDDTVKETARSYALMAEAIVEAGDEYGEAQRTGNEV